MSVGEGVTTVVMRFTWVFFYNDGDQPLVVDPKHHTDSSVQKLQFE